jgi:hypothetical protein
VSTAESLRDQSAISREAYFSDDGLYRYWLGRDWGLRRFSDGREPYVLWVGHNPSKAGTVEDDPTVRKEVGFTQRAGFCRYIKVNVMDFVATVPGELLRSDVKPRSPNNLDLVGALADRAVMIVCCWGRVERKLSYIAEETAQLLYRLKPSALWCLGTNQDGSPKHPLYLPYAMRFEKFWPVVPVVDKMGHLAKLGTKWSPR